MNGFDFIENRLKLLIEKSASYFPWVDKSAELMVRLYESIREIVLEDNQLSNSPPYHFIVKMNPKDLVSWEKFPHWQEDLTVAYEAILNEYGIKLETNPIFDLIAKNSLSKGDINIEAIIEDKPHEKTNAVNYINPNHKDKSSTNSVFPVLLFSNHKDISLSNSVTTIGRRKTNDIVIDDIRISRTHAQIRRTANGYLLFDTASTSGTFVNGDRISQRVLKTGDVISLGGYTFIYLNEKGPVTPKTQSSQINDRKSEKH